MCFRFDGENAVTTCRPETCGERLRAAGARNPMPTATGGELAGSPLPISLRPLMSSQVGILPLHPFRCISCARHAAPFSLCRTCTNNAFEGGDDETNFTHFAPPLAAGGLSRFTAYTHVLMI